MIEALQSSVGPWQYPYPSWVLPLPHYPGYTTHLPTAHAPAGYTLQQPAQRLADSVKTAVSGSSTYRQQLPVINYPWSTTRGQLTVISKILKS